MRTGKYSPEQTAQVPDGSGRQALVGTELSPHLSCMRQRALRDEILRLPTAERLKLGADIWDGLARSPEAVSVPDGHREVLDDRLDAPAEHTTLTWGQVQKNARRRQRRVGRSASRRLLTAMLLRPMLNMKSCGPGWVRIFSATWRARLPLSPRARRAVSMLIAGFAAPCCTVFHIRSTIA